MTKLKISPDLSLPTDAVTSTFVAYGAKGMGKTNWAAVFVEELSAAHLRFAVIDPMGVLWGLRHSADGKGPGVKALLLGGIHGDMPIDPTSGERVADLIVDDEDEVDVIVDISRHPNGTMWSVGERIKFVTAYAKRLYQRQGEKRRPIMQVIDEAARFAPQIVRAGDIDVAKCMGAVAVMVEEGRNVGIGVTLVTQRSARLNKDVAELADCMIAFRTMGPNSMRAVLEWLGQHIEKARLNDLSEKLRGLPIGTALVVSPGWLEFEGIAAMRKRRTFDSSATPKPGQVLQAKGPATTPDLAKYRALMADVIARATENDPKTLKARIAELEKQLAAKPAAPGATKTIETPVLKADQLKRLESVVDALDNINANWIEQAKEAAGELRLQLDRSTTAAEVAKEIATTLRAALNPAPVQNIRAVPAMVSPRPATVIAPRATDLRPKAAPNIRADVGSPACTGALRRIMIALAQHPGWLTDSKISVFSGVGKKGGSFGTYLSRARGAGWIEDGGGGTRRITEAGLAALGDYEKLPTGPDLAAFWMGHRKLAGAASKILMVLIDAYPEGLDDETIGERAGVGTKGGSFGTYLSRLRSRDLLQDLGGRTRKASDILFEGAR